MLLNVCDVCMFGYWGIGDFEFVFVNFVDMEVVKLLILVVYEGCSF